MRCGTVSSRTVPQVSSSHASSCIDNAEAGNQSRYQVFDGSASAERMRLPEEQPSFPFAQGEIGSRKASSCVDSSTLRQACLAEVARHQRLHSFAVMHRGIKRVHHFLPLGKDIVIRLIITAEVYVGDILRQVCWVHYVCQSVHVH